MQRLHAVGRTIDGKDLCYDLTPAIERFFAIKGVAPHAIKFSVVEHDDPNFKNCEDELKDFLRERLERFKRLKATAAMYGG